MSKPKIYRRRQRGAPATQRYGVRPASDRALGVLGVALAVVALLGLAAAVILG